MQTEAIATLIEDGLESARALVASDDGSHFSALVISPAFAGERTLVRHQMVYDTLGEYVGREIHALSLKTVTPEEWEASGGGA